MSNAIKDVIAERERQQSVEGWTPEHDDTHDDGEMAAAAASYAMTASGWAEDKACEIWPARWSTKWFKPTTPRRDLVKAAALIIAEIERLDRAEGRAADTEAAPATHVLPPDVVASLLAMGRVEWGTSLYQTDEKHIEDLRDTLRITREHFGTEAEETAIHGVYLDGTNTVLAYTGNSPNSPQHARILAGAWNQLVDLAESQAKAEGRP